MTATSAASVSERSPLLTNTSISDNIATQEKERVRRNVVLLIFMSMFALGLGGFMEYAPQTTIFETIICKEHYDRQTATGVVFSLRAVDCKIEPVQSRLALITGWKETLDQLPGIVLAVPYGIIADRYGRRPVYALGLLGWLLEAACIRVIVSFPDTFPLWLVLVATSIPIIGGGLRVMISMLFTMLSDISTPDERTKLFSRAISIFLVSQIVSMTSTAAVMEMYGPWPPYLAGMAFYVLALTLACCVPETRTIFRRKSLAESPLEDALPAARTAARGLRTRLADAASFVKKNGSVCILIASIFAGTLATPAVQFLIIYVPRRFPTWSISQASTLVSLRAFLYLILLAAGLPAVTHVFHRRMKVAQGVIDLRFTQLSAALLGISLFLIGISPSVYLIILSVVLFSIGSAMDLLIRSVATTLVDPDHVAALFTGLAVVESLAVFCAGPALAALFSWGMLLDGEWQGLPFYAVGTLLLFSAVGLLFVKLPKRADLAKPPEESVDESLVQQELYI